MSLAATAPRHFINLPEIGKDELLAILDDAAHFKATRGTPLDLFKGMTLAMVFDKASTRTRMSFQLAFEEMGGRTQVYNQGDLQLGQGESIKDTARVMSRYVHAIMIRMSDHDKLEEFAANASVPVINAMTFKSHPCQIMADMMTIREHMGRIEGAQVAWVGDTGNVARAFMQASEIFGFKLTVATPQGVMHKMDIPTQINLTSKPMEAAKDADIIVTDSWRSKDKMLELEGTDYGVFFNYQVNAALMALAKPNAVFMHCMPAFRGLEVTDEVMDSPQSVAVDEAENRLHTTKAILKWCRPQLKARVS